MRLNRDSTVAVVCVAGAAGALAAVLLLGPPRPPLPATILLSAIGLLMERRRVSVDSRLGASATYLPVALALVIGGPLAGAVVSSVSFLAYFERPYARWLVWTSTNATAALIGGAVSWTAWGEPRSLAQVFRAAIVAGGLNLVASLAFATMTIAARRGPWRDTLRAGAVLLVTAATVYVPMVGALAFAYTRISIWALVIVFPPIVAAQQLLVLYQQQKETAERLAQAVEVTEATNRDLETANTELASKNRELEEANFSFAASLIVSLDARDHYTAGHSAAVAVYSRDVARRIGLDEEEQRRAYLAGLMHDIGKVGLPPGILEKPSALSPEEETMMQQHVLIGERILAPVRQFHDLAPAVRHHHERFDGVGYPDGLADENIPLLARLIAVADTYNAMTSDRPYRRALAPGDAIEQLRALAGTQLDPDVALAFVGVLTEADAAYRVARRNEFVIDFRNLGTSVPLAALTRS